MPRYLLFLSQDYPHQGGWENDLHGVFDSIDEAKAEASRFNYFHRGEIVDIDTLRYSKMTVEGRIEGTIWKQTQTWTADMRTKEEWEDFAMAAIGIEYLHPDDQEHFGGDTSRCAKCQETVPYNYGSGMWCQSCGRFFCSPKCVKTELDNQADCKLCNESYKIPASPHVTIGLR
jgi:hypothetical protein